jgi:hypothetical protein
MEFVRVPFDARKKEFNLAGRELVSPTNGGTYLIAELSASDFAVSSPAASPTRETTGPGAETLLLSLVL